MNISSFNAPVRPEMDLEIQKHHAALKQFIDVSFDSAAPSRKDSERESKAREKLLKLSPAQFVELSTDVYDELNRRINESREEPDHLLAKDTFHPRRNQAREKLSSLHAKRFKDLVNDILYEIERRYSPPLPKEEFQALDLSPPVPAQHGVQSKTVIPTKATMAWSSDEEDEPENYEDNHSKKTSRPPTITSDRGIDNLAYEVNDQVPEMVSVGNSPSNKHSSNSSIKRGLSINKDREIQMLLEEGTKMDGKITDLEAQIEQDKQEITRLKSENSSLSAQLLSDKDLHEDQLNSLNKLISSAPNKNQFLLLQSQYDALQSSHTIVSDRHKGLLDEIDTLRDQIADLTEKLQSKQLSSIDKSLSSHDDGSLITKIQDQLYQLAHTEPTVPQRENSEASIDYWRDKFESARSDFLFTNLKKADLSDASFQDYVSDSGLIEMKHLSEFQASVEKFYFDLSDDLHNKNEVFKLVSSIATKADLLSNSVNPENEALRTLKSCVTHSIVVARHFVSNSTILPSAVLHVAVNDVALSVCDLIKSVKLLSVSKEKKFLNSNDISTPALQDMAAPSFVTETDASSPVRPLRMIERLNSPLLEKPSQFSSVQEKRLAIANSPLAPIVTQVIPHEIPTDQQTSSGSVSSPRGPGIISLASKNAKGTEQTTPSKSPPAAKKIMERAQIFESPEQDLPKLKKTIPEISASSSDGFAKFGAKRRSSLTPSVTDESAVPVALSNSTRSDNVQSNEDRVLREKNVEDDLNRMPTYENETKPNGFEKNSEETSKKAGLSEALDENNSSSESNYVSDIGFDKAATAANFKVDEFNVLNPDNTLHELLLYLEHQTVDVISTIQTLLASIKKPESTRGMLRDSAKDIGVVVGQMTEATNTSMSQTRNVQLREHGRWVVQNLEDCGRRMEILCGASNKSSDAEYADKNFKQRLAGVVFDIAKSTKELVKSVEELSLKQEIAVLDARLAN